MDKTKGLRMLAAISIFCSCFAGIIIGLYNHQSNFSSADTRLAFTFSGFFFVIYLLCMRLIDYYRGGKLINALTLIFIYLGLIGFAIWTYFSLKTISFTDFFPIGLCLVLMISYCSYIFNDLD